MSKIGNFDILKVMAQREMDVQLAPIGSNFLGAKYNQKGNYTRVEIAFPGNVIAKIMTQSVLGGLLLFDLKQYTELRKELEQAEEVK